MNEIFLKNYSLQCFFYIKQVWNLPIPTFSQFLKQCNNYYQSKMNSNSALFNIYVGYDIILYLYYFHKLKKTIIQLKVIQIYVTWTFEYLIDTVKKH